MKVEFILGIGCGGVRTVVKKDFKDGVTHIQICKELENWMRERIYLDYRIVEENTNEE